MQLLCIFIFIWKDKTFEKTTFVKKNNVKLIKTETNEKGRIFICKRMENLRRFNLEKKQLELFVYFT